MDEYGDGRKYRKEAAAISGLYCCQTEKLSTMLSSTAPLRHED